MSVDLTERVARLIALAALEWRADAQGVPTDSAMAQTVLGVAVDFLWRDYVKTAESVIEAIERGEQ